MKPKICKFDGCEAEAINFPNSTIKQRYCKDHAIGMAISKVRLNTIKTAKNEHKQKVDSARSKSYFEKLLQTEINAIVRLIDFDKGCISCDHGWNEQWHRQRHAGHRISIGRNPTLRYNLFNIWVQCSICNNYLSGNERMFDKGISNHYGLEILELIKELPSKTGCLSLSKEELGFILRNRLMYLKKKLDHCLSNYLSDPEMYQNELTLAINDYTETHNRQKRVFYSDLPSKSVEN